MIPYYPELKEEYQLWPGKGEMHYIFLSCKAQLCNHGMYV